jgi:hypothetical protein
MLILETLILKFYRTIITLERLISMNGFDKMQKIESKLKLRRKKLKILRESLN